MQPAKAVQNIFYRIMFFLFASALGFSSEYLYRRADSSRRRYGRRMCTPISSARFLLRCLSSSSKTSFSKRCNESLNLLYRRRRPSSVCSVAVRPKPTLVHSHPTLARLVWCEDTYDKLWPVNCSLALWQNR